MFFLVFVHKKRLVDDFLLSVFFNKINTAALLYHLSLSITKINKNCQLLQNVRNSHQQWSTAQPRWRRRGLVSPLRSPGRWTRYPQRKHHYLEEWDKWERGSQINGGRHMLGRKGVTSSLLQSPLFHHWSPFFFSLSLLIPWLTEQWLVI